MNAIQNLNGVPPWALLEALTKRKAA